MIGEKIYALIGELFNINRSITGEGVRETLSIIKNKHLPGLDIHEVQTGTVVADWIIPEEWNILDAYIKDGEGNKIVDFKNHNLHVVSYSVSVDKTMTLDELDQHLYSLPEMPDAIPYVTSYYRKKWGFCITDRQRVNLKQDQYRVVIDSYLENGSLTYADIDIPGKQKDEIFFSTYICHPSMANNELSGPGVATYIAKKIAEKSNRYSYRFVFAPETIGSITYISRNKQSLKENVIAAFNLTCLGDDHNMSYLPSRKGNTLADKVAKHVLKYQKRNFDTYSFVRDRESDERQYCSPGIDLPMISIMRSKYGSYPEYHTSLDNMDFISAEGLERSYRIHMDCIDILENNYYYESQVIGEPFLSKRGMNFMIVGGKENEKSCSAQLVLDIMVCCDGTKDIIDIAEELGQNACKLIPLFYSLEKEGLLSRKVD